MYEAWMSILYNQNLNYEECTYVLATYLSTCFQAVLKLFLLSWQNLQWQKIFMFKCVKVLPSEGTNSIENNL